MHRHSNYGGALCVQLYTCSVVSSAFLISTQVDLYCLMFVWSVYVTAASRQLHSTAIIICIKCMHEHKILYRPKSKGEAVRVKKFIPTFLVPNWNSFLDLALLLVPLYLYKLEERRPVYIDHCSLHVTGYIMYTFRGMYSGCLNIVID